jgi:hypothetical protein
MGDYINPKVRVFLKKTTCTVYKKKKKQNKTKKKPKKQNKTKILHCQGMIQLFTRKSQVLQLLRVCKAIGE